MDLGCRGSKYDSISLATVLNGSPRRSAPPSQADQQPIDAGISWDSIFRAMLRD